MKNECGKKERLDKILAAHGFGSRKDVRSLLSRKRVLVNGEIVTQADTHVNLESDKIEVDGEPILIQSHAYFMMNKAAGYVCSKKDGAHPSVFNLISDDHAHRYLGGELSLIGRLDVDTEGLLIFTTDGQLNHTLTSPKKRVPKVYLVQLKDSASEKEQADYAKKLKDGIHIPADGKEPEDDCLPAEIEWIFKSDEQSAESKKCDECKLTVYEGKYHEIKRMFLALENEVTYLKRLSMAGLKLDENLKPGEYRELSEEEINILEMKNED